jgi:beta-lactamase class C
MMRSKLQIVAPAVVLALLFFPLLLLSRYSGAAELGNIALERGVAHALRPVMKRYGIPGMSVGVVVGGETHVYNYGVSSKATGDAVTDDTLFEVGSITKTFTATLAAYAQINGKLSLTDMASQYLPALRGSAFDRVSLVNLATHTSGGLPLQVPDDITNNDELMAYFQSWKPKYAPGSYRTYANPSIGMLGMIAARSMNGDFVTLLEGTVFTPLGLKHTFLDVPESQTANYAQGYTEDDTPIRMTPGVLAAETYGIRTTAGDLLRVLEVNMRMLDLDEKLQGAITATHTGYYRIGAMTQDLVWEQYRYPVTLTDLLAGNSPRIIMEANPVLAIDPPLAPRDDVLINKTGSTNGFSAYVAYVPGRKIGVVVLANRSYPIDARVRVGYSIVGLLEKEFLRGL